MMMMTDWHQSGRIQDIACKNGFQLNLRISRILRILESRILRITELQNPQNLLES